MSWRALALLGCAAAAGGCQCTGGFGTEWAPGNSGAFAVATVAGTQRLFLPMPDALPSGNAWLSVVDVEAAGRGTTGAPARRGVIDLGSAGAPTTVGANGTWVVAASGASRDVWICDAVKQTVITHLLLPDTYGVSGFSGGGGYVTGVAIDGAHRRAILAVWDGFALVDLPSGKISRHLDAPPSENFGFDSFRGRLVAPFYECSTGSLNGAPPAVCADYPGDGLNVIDLETSVAWRYENPSARDPAAPVGGEPDSAAVDPNTGLALVSSELGGFENVIELGQAEASPSAGTVAAPHTLVTGLAFTGIAIDPDGRLGFFEEEFSAAVAVMSLPGGRPAVGLLPDAPGAVAWENLGDPHGAAAMALGGRPMGLVVNRQKTWVARIDLDAMATLPLTSGIIAPGDLAAAVTYLDPRTP